MRFPKIPKAAIAAFAIACLSGCATTVQLNYRTQPDGAQLYAGGRYLGAGAGSVGARLSKSQWNAGQHCVVMPPVEARWVSGAEVREAPRRVCLQAFTGGVVYRDALIARPGDVPGLRMDLDYADQLARRRLAERQTRAVEAAAAAAAAEARAHAHEIRLRERRQRQERQERERRERLARHERKHEDRGHGSDGHGNQGHADQGHADQGHADQGHADQGHRDHAAAASPGHQPSRPRLAQPVPHGSAHGKPPQKAEKPAAEAGKKPAKPKAGKADKSPGKEKPGKPRRHHNPKLPEQPEEAGPGG